MISKITKYMFIFVVFAIIGWLYEFTISIAEGRMRNPGFNDGPFLPIYGVGICIFYLFSEEVKVKLWQRIVAFITVATVIELVTGLIVVDLMGNPPLWDYSNWPLNFRGHISAFHSAIWGVFGALFYLLLYPHLSKALNRLVRFRKFTLTTGILFGMVAGNIIHTIVIRMIS